VLKNVSDVVGVETPYTLPLHKYAIDYSYNCHRNLPVILTDLKKNGYYVKYQKLIFK